MVESPLARGVVGPLLLGLYSHVYSHVGDNPTRACRVPSACLRLHVVPLPYSVGTFGLLPYKKWLPLFGLSRGSRKAGFFERVLRAGVGALTPSWCKDLLLGVPARVTISQFSVYSSQRGSPVASGPLRLRGSGARTVSASFSGSWYGSPPAGASPPCVPL